VRVQHAGIDTGTAASKGASIPRRSVATFQTSQSGMRRYS
jgi:hypothetical protein